MTAAKDRVEEIVWKVNKNLYAINSDDVRYLITRLRLAEDEINTLTDKLNIAREALEAISKEGFYNHEKPRQWVPTSPGIIAKQALGKIGSET